MKLPILRINQRNEHGRIYTHESVNVIMKQFREKTNNNLAVVGEFPQPERSTIDLRNASHEVVSLILEDDVLYGEIRPYIPFIQDKMGLKLNIRAFASITHDGIIEIAELITFDLHYIEFKFLTKNVV